MERQQRGTAPRQRRAADDGAEATNAASRNRAERRDGASGPDKNDELDVPEFLPPG